MAEAKPKNTVTMKIHGTAVNHARLDVDVRDLKVVIDEPELRGGTNQGATPTETIAIALAGCLNVMGHRCAERVGVDIRALDISVDAQFDRRGVSFEAQIDVPFPQIDVVLNVTTDASDAKIEELKAELARSCPVSTMLRQAGTQLNEHWNVTRP